MDLLGRVLLGVLAVAGAAEAQPMRCDMAPTETAGPETLDAAFFAPFSPSNAAEVLSHVPGFAIEDGGGAPANVLIDGQRPARSQPLNALLSRIPAAQVLRVEILRGAEAAAAVPGRTIVVNIVRAASAGDGMWSAGIEFAGGDPSPRGALSWTGRAGGVEYGVGATVELRDRFQIGESISTDANGATLSTRREYSPRTSEQYAFTAQAAAPVGDGGRISVNGEYAARNRREDAFAAERDTTLKLTEEESRAYSETLRDLEFGASLEHDLGPWQANLDGIVTRVDFDSSEAKRRDELALNETITESRTRARDLSGALVRGTLAQELSETQRLEIGVEVASETLDSARDEAMAGPGWSHALNADVLVEQERAQAYAAHSWRAAPGWSVETRLARETASLRFAEEADQTFDVAYWRPSLQVARELGERSQIRARVYRDVGRVNVEEIANALAENATPNGIPALAPDMSWRAELRTDVRFGERGSFGVTLSRAWLDDALEWIVVNGADGQSFDAPGNIGAGEVSAVNVNLSTPVEPIPGGSFSINAGLADSAVTDPVTGAERTLGAVQDIKLWMEFRQEVAAADFSWGVSYYRQSQTTWRRRGEVGSYEDGPYVDAFFETTAIEGVKARLRASSVLDRPATVQRLVYAPDSTGMLDSIETTNRYDGATISLSLAGSF